MKPTDVVAFDIDDTLFLERDYVRSGFRAVGEWAARQLGIHDFAEAAWATFHDGVRGTIFDAALARCGRAPEAGLIDTLVSIYRAHPPTIRLLADASECLRRLTGRARLAVITDGPLESQRSKVRALDLDACVEYIIFTAELGPGLGKPHPRAFELCEERFRVSGERCAYVADNPRKDFTGPAARGWRTVRLRRPDGLHAGLSSGPEVAIELADLQSLPARLGLDG